MAPPYKFTFNDTPPSDEDIKASQHFDKLLEKREKILKKRSLMKKWAMGLAIVTLFIGSIVLFQFMQQEEDKPSVPSLSKLESLKPSVSIIDTLSIPEHPINKVSEIVPTVAPKRQTSDPLENAPAIKDSAQSTEGNFTEARPKGGYEALYTYIAEALEYPVTARTDSIEGTVMIEFKIDKEGSTQDAKVIQSVREDIDQEALRLIGNMSPWYPAMINDIPITTRQIIPITFKIDLQGEEN
ncbi:energy transducer TonB [Catalinimonas sp. 4WD22]|uniref:energy transducer TonB n=1 Tax=Catalinimonas locisalis TaxID=3133978 RepID=UPI0031011260